MAPARDDDLNWLYGRDRQTSEPEPTRLLPAPSLDDDTPAPQLYRAAPERPGYQPGPLPPPPTARPIQPAPPPASPYDPQGTEGSEEVPARRRPRPARVALGVLGVVVALLLVWLIAVPGYAWSRIRRVDDVPAGDRPSDQPGTTFLLVGSDSREGLSKADRLRLGTGSSAGQRTDTIMILSIPPGGRPALISIPRDSYVPIPGKGQNKINAAYAFGGPKLLVRTVEQSTGLRVDAYTEIGFGGFVSVIDALGGIRMCLPKAIKDRDSHLDLPKGCQTLNGTNALGYVRMRKADPLGDLGRVQRQRQMLAAVAQKGASPVSVINPARYWRLSTAGADALALGQDTSFVEVVKMALAMRKVSGAGGLTLTVPVSSTNASTPAGSAVLWDNTKAKAMFADIARGDTGSLEKYAK